MKERALNCKDWEVRAILDGTKTQTRRVVKIPKRWEHDCHMGDPMDGKPTDPLWPHCLGGDGRYHKLACPYGQPGDRLWVRETWMACDTADLRVQLLYKASNDPRPSGVSIEDYGAAKWFDRPDEDVDKYQAEIERMDVEGDRWRPSIHMPRWASRITLEIVSVRVERLQEISEEDAIAEGIRELPLQEKEPGAWWCADPLGNTSLHCRTPRAAFARLWESINPEMIPILDDDGKRIGMEPNASRWDANQFCWRLTFKRIG